MSIVKIGTIRINGAGRKTVVRVGYEYDAAHAPQKWRARIVGTEICGKWQVTKHGALTTAIIAAEQAYAKQGFELDEVGLIEYYEAGRHREPEGAPA